MPEGKVGCISSDGTVGLLVDFREVGESPMKFFAKVLADGTVGY